MAPKAGRYIALVWDPDVPAASIRDGSPSGPEICTVKAQDLDGIKKLVGMLNDRADLLEALKEGRRAIGEHSAPTDCYATGPLTGDPLRDLVECPACRFISLYDAALTKAGAL